MMTSLAGANVLVTRPQGQADGLLAAIGRAGGRAWHYPVMAISELDTTIERERIQRCKQLMLQLDQYQHVIFISCNAVHFGMEWIHQYWPQLPMGIHWYGMGNKTIAELTKAGVPVANDNNVAQKNPMNSEALLELASLQQLEHQKVLIIRGIGGRQTLQQQLSQRGAQVHYAECYQRTLVNKPVGEMAVFIEQQGINSMCVNSGESLQNVCRLAGSDNGEDQGEDNGEDSCSNKLKAGLAESHSAGFAAIKKLLLVVPGERVAAIARQRGFEQIAIANNASDEAMVAALLQSYPTL